MKELYEITRSPFLEDLILRQTGLETTLDAINRDMNLYDRMGVREKYDFILTGRMASFPRAERSNPQDTHILKRDFRLIKGKAVDNDPERQLKLVVSYSRSRPQNIPRQYWPAKLRGIKPPQGYNEGDIGYVPEKKLLSLSKQELSDLINNPTLFTEFLSLESFAVGFFSFNLHNGKLTILPPTGSGLNLLEGYEHEFARNVIAIYARANYTALSRATPQELSTVATASDKLKRQEKRFLDKLKDVKPVDIFDHWEEIFGYPIDPVEFLRIFILANIEYMLYLDNPKRKEFEFRT